MTTAALKRFHAGEVYVAENLSIIFECKSCDERFGVYAQFLDHILGKHFDDWTASDEDIQGENTNTKEPDRCLSNNEQSLANESSVGGKYYTVDDLITEILQPMEYDELAVLKLAEEPQINTTAEESIKNTRPVIATQTTNNVKDRKYVCKTCEAVFTLIANLRLHQQRHTNIKTFTCLKCDRAFNTSTHLNNHLRRHNGEKPFMCSYCGMDFVTATSLKNHERRHTNDRPYKCKECDKSFFDAKQLRRHTVVHTKERNYSCEKCPATFTQKIALQNHMKLHANALEYECIICNRRFNQRCSLLLHMKRKHNVLNLKTRYRVSADKI